ncbi:MAG: FHA domain-containing protein, partial [Gemmataceae bacterium]|nr:FHA domain-containing protein [Gemmataceae bacterium]
MRIRLQLHRPGASPQTLEADGTSIHIGRDPASQLPLPDDAVSWQHARIDLEAGGGWITDLGSSNGTFIGGRRISGRAPLSVGDEISLGQAGPRLRVVGLPEDRPTPSPASARDPLALGACAVLGILVLLLGLAVWSQSSKLAALAQQADTLDKQRGEMADLIEKLRKEPPAPPADKGQEALAKQMAELAKALGTLNLERPPPIVDEPKKEEKKEEKKPPREEKGLPPSDDRAEIGVRGAALPPFPNVLAVRPYGKAGWEIAEDAARLRGGDLLLAPPLCRAAFTLDTGLRGVLWGDAEPVR